MYRKSRIGGWLCLAVLSLVTIFSTMYIAWDNDYKAVNGGDGEAIYKKPYCRVIVYAFGLGVAFILHTYRTHK